MDAVSLTILVHGIGMIALIMGGIAALFFGYRVIGSGTTGRAQSTATFKFLGLSGTAKGAGAVIMMTAGVWAYCGVRIAPNLATNSTGSKVYSFQWENGKVTAPELALIPYGPKSSNEPKTMDDAQIRDLFKNFVAASQAVAGSKPIVTIHGRPARIDADSASVQKQINGTVELATIIDSSGQLAELTYTAHASGPTIVFVPKGVESLSEANAVKPLVPQM